MCCNFHASLNQPFDGKNFEFFTRVARLGHILLSLIIFHKSIATSSFKYTKLKTVSLTFEMMKNSTYIQSTVHAHSNPQEKKKKIRKWAYIYLSTIFVIVSRSKTHHFSSSDLVHSLSLSSLVSAITRAVGKKSKKENRRPFIGRPRYGSLLTSHSVRLP